MARIAAVVDVQFDRSNEPMQAPIVQVLIWHQPQPVLQPHCLETSFDSDIERLNVVNEHHIRVWVAPQQCKYHFKIIWPEPIRQGYVGQELPLGWQP
jgi:hypothetical protein